MQANRSVSRRERDFRKALWMAGARGYRLQGSLPGRPDLVFPGARVAVFVHGCFWHQCPSCDLPIPKQNRAFWVAKFAENQARDDRAADSLGRLGYEVLVVWEHDARDNPSSTAEHVVRHVQARRMERGVHSSGG